MVSLDQAYALIAGDRNTKRERDNRGRQPGRGMIRAKDLVPRASRYGGVGGTPRPCTVFPCQLRSSTVICKVKTDKHGEGHRLVISIGVLRKLTFRPTESSVPVHPVENCSRLIGTSTTPRWCKKQVHLRPFARRPYTGA